MKSLFDEIEASAVKVVMIDGEDLTGLASLHTHFQTIAALAAATESPFPDAMKTMQSAAGTVTGLIEQMILDEILDTAHTIGVIEGATRSLQQMAECLIQNRPPSAISFPPELNLPGPAPKPAGATNAPQSGTCIPLPDNVDEDIFREFLANIPFELEKLESAIMAAEKEPCVENRNAIKGILHNMKGESALMGLNALAAVCHEAESLIIDQPEPFPGEKLLAHKDWLQNAIGQIIGRQQTIDRNEPAAEAGAAPPAGTIPVVEAEPPATETAYDELMIAEGDKPLVMDFVNESNEHLENAEAILLEIEENPEDPERINAIFRAFHTIKGVAGFLNLKQIGSLAHAAENLLDLSRKGNLYLAGASIDVIFESMDVMKRMMSGLRDGMEHNHTIKSYPLLDDLIERIKLCATGQSPPKRLGELLVEQGTVSSETVRDALRIQREAGNKVKLGDVLIEAGMASRDQIEQAIITQKNQPARAANKGAAQGAAQAAAEPEAADRPGRKVAAESTVKVTTERLDAMINMVGELVIAQSMVSQDLGLAVQSNQRLERNARHLDKLTRDLQELSMSMRMVPVQGVFQKMARLVRDLSRKADKEIEFQMNGAETELDRNVVEAIADPLVHMVRNSIDHGIEPPQERLCAGKARAGRIILRAFHKGGNIVIQIADDGRGLNRARILEKAIAGGLVKEGADLSDQDIYRLIFHAGLSTAEKVTSISGRGVGMDVVRKNIESMRGRIDIESTLGQGTTFTIYLPLTLAVIDGQEVTVGREHYIIPIISIEQNFRPTAAQISTLHGGRGEMVLVRGDLLPLVRLHHLFHVQPTHLDPCQSLVVIVSDGEQRCGIQVDALLGQQQVVIKSLGDFMGSIQGISGGAIMGNGNVSLILDIPGLMQLAHKHGSPAGVDAA